MRAVSSAPAAQLRLEPTPLTAIPTNQNTTAAAPAKQQHRLLLEPTPLNPMATNQNAASGKLNSMNTFVPSENSVPDAENPDINPHFPIYSYKRYKPLPTVVFTQHEEEANDLIAGLKPGYVVSFFLFFFLFFWVSINTYSRFSSSSYCIRYNN